LDIDDIAAVSESQRGADGPHKIGMLSGQRLPTGCSLPQAARCCTDLALAAPDRGEHSSFLRRDAQAFRRDASAPGGVIEWHADRDLFADFLDLFWREDWRPPACVL
jgi:hypothetical protein